VGQGEVGVVLGVLAVAGAGDELTASLASEATAGSGGKLDAGGVEYEPLHGVGGGICKLSLLEE
jgi:hypothetical protein